MTETNKTADASQGVTVKLSKLTEGIGLVFSGVMVMLEALDAGTARTLTEGFARTEDDTAADKEDISASRTAAEAEGTADPVPLANAEICDPDGESNADGAADHTDGATDATDAPGTASPVEEKKEAVRKSQPVSGLTVDDVARIVVQKVKANPGINDKIRALVNAHGAQRVTELNPEVLEAFLTDLSQL